MARDDLEIYCVEKEASLHRDSEIYGHVSGITGFHKGFEPLGATGLILGAVDRPLSAPAANPVRGRKLTKRVRLKSGEPLW